MYHVIDQIGENSKWIWEDSQMLDCMHYVEMKTFRLCCIFFYCRLLSLLIVFVKMNDLNRRLFTFTWSFTHVNLNCIEATDLVGMQEDSNPFEQPCCAWKLKNNLGLCVINHKGYYLTPYWWYKSSNLRPSCKPIICRPRRFSSFLLIPLISCLFSIYLPLLCCLSTKYNSSASKINWSSI